MSETERARIIKRPWSRADSVREVTRRKTISDIVADFKERERVRADKLIRSIKATASELGRKTA